jgi:quinol monooxygenase YgiN
MLVIAGRIQIDAANREVAIAAAVEVMDATRREKGCISYTFSADLSDDGVFHLFEEWDSQDALDAHFKTPHMATFQGKLGSLGVKDMKIRRYEIASVGPIGG